MSLKMWLKSHDTALLMSLLSIVLLIFLITLIVSPKAWH